MRHPGVARALVGEHPLVVRIGVGHPDRAVVPDDAGGVRVAARPVRQGPDGDVVVRVACARVQLEGPEPGVASIGVVGRPERGAVGPDAAAGAVVGEGAGEPVDVVRRLPLECAAATAVDHDDVELGRGTLGHGEGERLAGAGADGHVAAVGVVAVRVDAACHGGGVRFGRADHHRGGRGVGHAGGVVGVVGGEVGDGRAVDGDARKGEGGGEGRAHRGLVDPRVRQPRPTAAGVAGAHLDQVRLSGCEADDGLRERAVAGLHNRPVVLACLVLDAGEDGAHIVGADGGAARVGGGPRDLQAAAPGHHHRRGDHGRQPPERERVALPDGAVLRPDRGGEGVGAGAEVQLVAVGVAVGVAGGDIERRQHVARDQRHGRHDHVVGEDEALRLHLGVEPVEVGAVDLHRAKRGVDRDGHAVGVDVLVGVDDPHGRAVGPESPAVAPPGPPR